MYKVKILKIIMCILFLVSCATTNKHEKSIFGERTSLFENNNADKNIEKEIIVTEIGYAQKHLSWNQQKTQAKEAAITRCYRTLARQIHGAYIEGNKTMRNTVIEEDRIYEMVDGIVREAEIVETKYLSNNECQITMKIKPESIRELNLLLNER